MYEQSDTDDVLIMGCDSGLDFDVRHRDREVEIRLKDQAAITMPAVEWRAAVLAFSEAIQAFYASSSSKQPGDQIDARGYEVFCAEWNRRYKDARRAA